MEEKDRNRLTLALQTTYTPSHPLLSRSFFYIMRQIKQSEWVEEKNRNTLTLASLAFHTPTTTTSATTATASPHLSSLARFVSAGSTYLSPRGTFSTLRYFSWRLSYFCNPPASESVSSASQSVRWSVSHINQAVSSCCRLVSQKWI